MNTTRARGWLLFALFVVAGCGGGNVQGVGGNGGGTGGGEEASTGPGDDMVGSDAEIGFNDGGSPIDPRCASGSPIGTGLACSASGLVCPLGTIADCNGGQRTIDCFCEGNTWSCEHPLPASRRLP
jgi:hypothetical protein